MLNLRARGKAGAKDVDLFKTTLTCQRLKHYEQRFF